MNVSSKKDFGPIQDDYLFFEKHATEASEDVRAYIPKVHGWLKEGSPIHMLDFGCGSGRFSSQFLAPAQFSPPRLWLSLVEPEPGYRQQAQEQLQAFTIHPVQAWPTLQPHLKVRFDLVLANHVFYYVPDLDEALAAIFNALNPSGLFLSSMAGKENILIQFMYQCFALIGKPFPYYIAEDVELALAKQNKVFDKQNLQYELAFPDRGENRLKIMRFLLGNYFDEVPRQAMMDLFTPYADAGRITIKTGHEHFVIRPQESK